MVSGTLQMNPAPSSPGASVRTFVAIHVPAGIQQQIAVAVDGVRHQMPEKSVRWVRPENVHLTLRFIGTVVSQDIEALQAAIQSSAQGVEPFSLELGKPGCFPHEHSPRVLWIGLAGHIEPLRQLQLRVADETTAWGRLEGREFHPHLTLGRVVTTRRDDLLRISAAIRAVSIHRCAPWETGTVHLMQSVLAPNGSVYSTLASFPLSDGR